MSDAFTVLPSRLPVPVDDGAADGLPGLRLPPVRFASTAGGEVDRAEAAEGTPVPARCPAPAARVSRSPPAGTSPGARGCTPQSCAFRDERAAIAAQGARVLGLSAQPLEELRELTERLVLRYPLLNDPELRLAAALGMPRLAGFAARSTSA